MENAVEGHGERWADLNQITGDIVDAAYRVRNYLGPGLVERIYKLILADELRRRGHRVDVENEVAIESDGVRMDGAFRIDLLVDRLVIVEVKAVEALHPVHEAQILTYLRLAERPVGLLINFHSMPFRAGIRRFVGPVAQ